MKPSYYSNNVTQKSPPQLDDSFLIRFQLKIVKLLNHMHLKEHSNAYTFRKYLQEIKRQIHQEFYQENNKLINQPSNSFKIYQQKNLTKKQNVFDKMSILPIFSQVKVYMFFLTNGTPTSMNSQNMSNNGFEQSKISSMEQDQINLKRNIPQSFQNQMKIQTGLSEKMHNPIVEIEGQKRLILQVKRSSIKLNNQPNNTNSHTNNSKISIPYSVSTPLRFTLKEQKLSSGQSNFTLAEHKEKPSLGGKEKYNKIIQKVNQSNIQFKDKLQKQSCFNHLNSYAQNSFLNNKIQKSYQNSHQSKEQPSNVQQAQQQQSFKRDSSGTNFSNLYSIGSLFKNNGLSQADSELHIQKQRIQTKKIQKRKSQNKKIILGNQTLINTTSFLISNIQTNQTQHQNYQNHQCHKTNQIQQQSYPTQQIHQSYSIQQPITQQIHYPYQASQSLQNNITNINAVDKYKDQYIRNGQKYKQNSETNIMSSLCIPSNFYNNISDNFSLDQNIDQMNNQANIYTFNEPNNEQNNEPNNKQNNQSNQINQSQIYTYRLQWNQSIRQNQQINQNKNKQLKVNEVVQNNQPNFFKDHQILSPYQQSINSQQKIINSNQRFYNENGLQQIFRCPQQSYELKTIFNNEDYYQSGIKLLQNNLMLKQNNSNLVHSSFCRQNVSIDNEIDNFNKQFQQLILNLPYYNFNNFNNFNNQSQMFQIGPIMCNFKQKNQKQQVFQHIKDLTKQLNILLSELQETDKADFSNKFHKQQNTNQQLSNKLIQNKLFRKQYDQPSNLVQPKANKQKGRCEHMLNSSITFQTFIKVIKNFHQELYNTLKLNTQLFAGYYYQHSNQFNTYPKTKNINQITSNNSYIYQLTGIQFLTDGLIDKTSQICNGQLSFLIQRLNRSVQNQHYLFFERLRPEIKQKIIKQIKQKATPIQSIQSQLNDQIRFLKVQQMSQNELFLFKYLQNFFKNQNYIMTDPLYRFYNYEMCLQNTIKNSLWHQKINFSNRNKRINKEDLLNKSKSCLNKDQMNKNKQNKRETQKDVDKNNQISKNQKSQQNKKQQNKRQQSKRQQSKKEQDKRQQDEYKSMFKDQQKIQAYLNYVQQLQIEMNQQITLILNDIEFNQNQSNVFSQELINTIIDSKLMQKQLDRVKPCQNSNQSNQQENKSDILKCMYQMKNSLSSIESTLQQLAPLIQVINLHH